MKNAEFPNGLKCVLDPDDPDFVAPYLFWAGGADKTVQLKLITAPMIFSLVGIPPAELIRLGQWLIEQGRTASECPPPPPGEPT